MRKKSSYWRVKLSEETENRPRRNNSALGQTHCYNLGNALKRSKI